MNLLAFFTAFCACAAVPSAASPTKPAEAAAAPKVRQLRSRLAKVLGHSSALPSSIVEEARHVDADAARALRGKGAEDEAGLEKVLAEFASFSEHLTGRSEELKKEAVAHLAEHLPDGALEKAQKLVPTLEARVQKVMEHLKSDKGPESSEHAAVVATMEHALAKVDGQNAFERALELHNALKSAHGFLAKRTQELTADRAKLNVEIEEQEAYILFMMLKQRRKLPVKTQLAILKRRQFKNCSYAQQLLKSHKASQSLDLQLLAMLRSSGHATLADTLERKVAKGPAGSLAAAGSDGRVQIVSSHMKNVVQVMAGQMSKAKVQLEQIANDQSMTASERKQAQEVLSGLEAVIKKVASTHDLKSQMDAMTEMEKKLATWMVKFASHK